MEAERNVADLQRLSEGERLNGAFGSHSGTRQGFPSPRGEILRRICAQALPMSGKTREVRRSYGISLNGQRVPKNMAKSGGLCRRASHISMDGE
jgi:hypothetical protein